MLSYLNFFLNIFITCDAAKEYQMTIQDPATEIFEGMIDLYDLICFELIVVLSIVFTLLFSLLFNPMHHSNSQRTFSHSTELEVFWTIVPALLLIVIAYPSFTLLYALDDLTVPEFTIKIIGHQWYWSYEYNSGAFYKFEFDSYMINTSDLIEGQFRLLEVDNRLCLPIKTHLRLLITSADVLHSWSIPSFGIKVDACPGRLNQASLFIKRPGVYFGQCSEICGINHGFMPIVVVAVEPKTIISSPTPSMSTDIILGSGDPYSWDNLDPRLKELLLPTKPLVSDLLRDSVLLQDSLIKELTSGYCDNLIKRAINDNPIKVANPVIYQDSTTVANSIDWDTTLKNFLKSPKQTPTIVFKKK